MTNDLSKKGDWASFPARVTIAGAVAGHYAEVIFRTGANRSSFPSSCHPIHAKQVPRLGWQ